MKFATLTAIVFGTVACLAQTGQTTPQTGQTTPQPPAKKPTDKGITQCTNGSIQCCDSLKRYDELNLEQQNSVSNIVGGTVHALHGQFGVTCTPVSVLGLSGIQCNSQTVCCQNVESSALVSITCVPININL